MSRSVLRWNPRALLVGMTAVCLLLTGVLAYGLPGTASATEPTCSPGVRAPAVTHAVRVAHAAAPAEAPCADPSGRDPNSGSGSPPLLFHGGPMMSTPASGDRIVVTPIFWAPSGYSFDAVYQNLLNRYLTDAAHDSDRSTNVFSTLFEYSGTNGYINYRMSKAATIYDTAAFPAAGCTTSPGPIYQDKSGYTTCVNDAQVRAEVDRVVTARGLLRDLGHIYVLFLPKHVESCFYSDPNTKQACTLSPTAATGGYCAYHNMTSHKTVYANMPFPIYSSVIPFTCGSEASFPTNESPNGNTDADVEISPLSHEISEAMTDPDVSTGWYDSSGFENGDECAYKYGAASGKAGALYNQTLNGHHYLTQEEFSNNNFNQGKGGCLQTYIPAAKPKVTSLSAHSGGAAGGTAVTIVGSTLAGADHVYFGTTPATFRVIDPTHIVATAPSHTVGTVDVTVHNSLGSSPAVAADHFSYS
jgi:hypothetical protein